MKRTSLFIFIQNLFPACVIFLFVLALAGSASGETIESDALKVTIDPKFPRVLEYVWKANGAVIYGQEDALSSVTIDGVSRKPQVAFTQTGDKAAYAMTFPEINVEMRAELEVKAGVLSFQITSIVEKGTAKVHTLEFPNQGLISVRSAQAGACLAANKVGASQDTFLPLADANLGETFAAASYVVLNTDKLAATMTNNTLDEWIRLVYNTLETQGGKKFSVCNNKWIYREIDTETVDLPWCLVAITGDVNKDGVVNWQDGAIAYRGIMRLHKGAEIMRRSISHVAIDFASVAQWPFLRMLDNEKKLSLFMDGFPQMLLIKGYQSEGHDSAHPDYGGNFNEKAGGLKDFNYLCQKAKGYNVHIGVHINQTEAYPEARTYTNEMVTARNGWKWLDQSKKINQKADIVAGNLYRRLEELKKNAPDLSFVYVDVYSGKNWVEWKLGEKLWELGWPVWTEFHPHLDNYYIWTHQPAGGSRIGRFIMNGEKDTFGLDPILKGYYRFGFMGWDEPRYGYERDIHRVVAGFMTRNLPTKYMQNFDLLVWDDNHAVFSGGLETRLEDSKVNMYKSGRLIASDNNVFIPWDPVGEEKIYHWNEQGGAGEWQLPVSWSGVSKAVLYRLTDLGRVLEGEIPVAAGKVSIQAQAKTPYVLYKSSQPAQKTEWSEGGLVRDTGFDSHGFDYWTKASSGGAVDHITIENADYGQTYLKVGGGGERDAVISQRIQGLEPGKNYSASVWVEIDGRRPAGIRVSDFGGPAVERRTARTIAMNFFPNTDKCDTRYHRVRVDFTPTPGRNTALVSLVADKGDKDSVVRLDDVRVREIKPTPQSGHYYFEDFENVDEGWGPFLYGYKGACNTHLSEKHEGYTDDTIAGRYSLKSMDEGMMDKGKAVTCLLRTAPATLLLKPNSSYKVSFDYLRDAQNEFRVMVKTPDSDQPVLNAVLAKPESGVGHFSQPFKTGSSDESYISIEKTATGRGLVVIDNFTVDLGQP